MAELPEISRYLTSWGKDIIREAKALAPKASGQLAKSLKVHVIEDDGEYQVVFEMAGHGAFMDKGVRGTGGVIKTGIRKGTYDGKTWYTDEYGVKKISPFSYKKRRGHTRPSSRYLDQWTVRKGIAPRTKGGQFQTRKSLTFAIAKVIGIRGIQGTSFFSKPLGKGLKKLPNEFAQQFAYAILRTLKIPK